MISHRRFHRPLLLCGALFLFLDAMGCAPSLPQGQLVLCQKSRNEVMETARQGLISTGFSIERYLPDSGYIRTAAKRIQTVNEISTGLPSIVRVEAQHTSGVLNVVAWHLDLTKGVGDRYYMDEVQLMAGERLHIFHVGPFLDKMTEYCAMK